MISHQIICKILQDKSIGILFDNGITTDLFPIEYQEELNFIINHQNKYGNIPDTLSFLQEFNDFDIIEINERDNYLVDKLVENILYHKQVEFANEWGEKLGEGDSGQAFEFAKRKVEEIKQIEQLSTSAVDLTTDMERLDEYIQKSKSDELAGITTGNDKLDGILHGWLEEDLVIILGRTNEGKSWVLNYFLVNAWKTGKKVLLYSGEMSTTLVGYRFDTLNEHFSNTGLMAGKDDLGEPMIDGTNDKTGESYSEYLGNLKENNSPFIVVTPKSLGKQLDIPTLKHLIETHKPDIVGVDQLSLMTDYRSRKGEQLRIQYTHIAEDLYDLSEEMRVPILAPVQANREAHSKNTDKGSTGNKPPELHEISESDGIGQNATRVISILRNGVQLKLYVAKNRYGVRGDEVSYLWDINLGIFKQVEGANLSSGAVVDIDLASGELASGEELF